ncbi:hypothetical protein [Nocardioides sambongensis]|uniref:hypothetical protein n=1 Tax=Nocardioides sambongensis TaxID=2589074 RepID=UPI00112783AD|nr:hypothetical protein [Nocardioides sambongensis]
MTDPARTDVTTEQTPHGGRRWALAAVLTMLASAALGALGGWAWWSWWSPGFDGTVYETTEGALWLPEPFDPGFADAFTGTAQYALLGAGFGLVLGLVGALLLRRRPVTGLVVVLAGSAVAAAVMAVAGTAPSPPDPQTLASADTVGRSFPAHLEVTSWTPYLVWPVGAMFGYGTFMVTTAGALRIRDREDDPDWLQAGATRAEPEADVTPSGSDLPPPR